MDSSHETIYETLVNTASLWPDNLAVADEHGTLTYQELYKQVEDLKDLLLASGLRKGSHAVLITKNNRHFIVGLYALLACECVVMPLPPYQKAGEFKKALNEAHIEFILADTPDHNIYGATSKKIALSNHDLHLNAVRSECLSFISFLDHAAVMRFTSGTTGDAKCVILSHQSVLERIEAANEGLQLTAHDRVIWVLPMAYHFIVSIILYVRYGCGIIICEDFMAENILDKAIEHQGTFLYASPMHIRLLAACKKDYVLPKLTKVVSTTTAITPSICKAFQGKYRTPVSQAFGIIEVGLPIINLQHSSDHPEAVGYALPAYTVRVVDETFQPVPVNEVGHLAIKGPGMFDGYLTPPTLRQDVLKEGWFMTGDLAAMTKEGLIEIKGRTKNVINVSGNKVFPDEVEVVINSFPGIENSKVYSHNHPLMGEIVAAEIVLYDKNERFDSEELILHCRQHLSSFKVPQRITIVSDIALTGSGKIKRG